MPYDSKHWNWGVGFCELHRGQDLPCQRCIAENAPGLSNSADPTEPERSSGQLSQEQYDDPSKLTFSVRGVEKGSWSSGQPNPTPDNIPKLGREAQEAVDSLPSLGNPCAEIGLPSEPVIKVNPGTLFALDASYAEMMDRISKKHEYRFFTQLQLESNCYAESMVFKQKDIDALRRMSEKMLARSVVELPIDNVLCRRPFRPAPSEWKFIEDTTPDSYEPLRVRSLNALDFEVIDGARRWNAAHVLGWRTIKCIVLQNR